MKQIYTDAFLHQCTFAITQFNTKEDIESNCRLIKEFFSLYMDSSNFPDPSERERPKFIYQRVSANTGINRKMAIVWPPSNHPNPFTHLLAYELIHPDGSRKLTGGCVIEYYPDSRCVLVTYLFVDKDIRGKDVGQHRQKVAESLLKDSVSGLAGLIKMFKKPDMYGKVNAVYFESNNPLQTSEENDSMPPAKRLKFFSKQGAKRIPFDYIQPPLGEHQTLVHNLYLLTFPHLANLGSTLSIRTVMAFLLELTYSLDKNKTSNYYGYDAYKKDCDQLLNEDVLIEELVEKEGWGFSTLDASKGTLVNIHKMMLGSFVANRYSKTEDIYLEEVPLEEEPNLLFRRASICYEITVDEDYYEPSGLPPECCAVEVKNGQLTKTGWMRLLNRQPDFKQAIICPPSDNYCVVHHSYETDLFAYKYQREPPYFTSCFETDVQEVEIHIPQVFHYVSEGRKETFFQLHPKNDVHKLRMRLSLNYTYFNRSNIRIWHLILSTLDDYPINEYDVIKLMKFFSGSQENRSEQEKLAMLDSIQFYIPESSAVPVNQSAQRSYTLLQLFKFATNTNRKNVPLEEHYRFKKEKTTDTFNPSKVAAKESDATQKVANDTTHPEFDLTHSLRTGIVQIDFNQSFCEFTPNAVSRLQKRLSIEKIPDPDKLLSENPAYRHFHQLLAELHTRIKKISSSKAGVFPINLFDKANETLCGICLGILDFNRMSVEEVDDTITPRENSITSSSFLTINRGVLTSFAIAENVLESSWETIGISPYLTISSAVLAHNEYVVIEAESRLKQLLDTIKGETSTKKKTSTQQLVEQRILISDLVNDDYLPNVFQYKTEQDLYDYGHQHRGIRERYENAKTQLRQLDTTIDQRQSEETNIYQRNIQIGLAVVSLLQTYSLIKDTVKEYFDENGRPEVKYNQDDIQLLGIDNWWVSPNDLSHILFLSVGLLVGLFLYWEFSSRKSK